MRIKSQGFRGLAGPMDENHRMAFPFADCSVTLENMAITRTVLFYSWDWSEECVDW